MYEEPAARIAAPSLSPASTTTTAPEHGTTTVERGSFCLARCTCGWSGPARRSRDRARTDAEHHLSATDRPTV